MGCASSVLHSRDENDAIDQKSSTSAPRKTSISSAISAQRLVSPSAGPRSPLVRLESEPPQAPTTESKNTEVPDSSSICGVPNETPQSSGKKRYQATPFQRPDLYLLDQSPTPEQRHREDRLHKALLCMSWSLQDALMESSSPNSYENHLGYESPHAPQYGALADR